MVNTNCTGRLLADVGGTNARFAWQSDANAPITLSHTLSCLDFPSLQHAIERYLLLQGGLKPQFAAIAIANPICGDQVKMTNHHWSFSIRQLQAALGLSGIKVVNDFTALAMSLPLLKPHELHLVKAGEAVQDSAIGLIGPGTGLGVSGLIPCGSNKWIPIQGEGGHVTLPALTERERMVAKALARKYSHASAERAVSGMGLFDVFHILCETDQKPNELIRQASEITDLALNGHPQALEATQMLVAFLGTIAGNLALTLGAKGGVYLGGGVIPKLGTLFDKDLFIHRFKTKGRFHSYLDSIPVWLINVDQSPALLGVSTLHSECENA